MMKKTLWKVLAAGAALTCAAAMPAQATMYEFSYTSSAGVISGELDGALQADGNTVAVSGVTAGFNGGPAVALPIIATVEYFFTGAVNAPAVTLDGSVMSMLACTSAACIDGFYLDTVFSPILFGSPFVSSGTVFGDINEPYSAANWTISAVPVPSSLALLGLGLGLMARRRKAG